MALTKAQRARLERLATYLEGLPKNYRHFDMGSWIISDGEEAEIEYARKNGGVENCGTSACAAGHGPAAGVLVPPRFVGEFSVDWSGYCSLFVGSDYGASTWCFDGGWNDRDNHHYGAAARIRYLLEHGSPPDGFCFPDRHWLSVYAPYRIDAKAPANA